MRDIRTPGRRLSCALAWSKTPPPRHGATLMSRPSSAFRTLMVTASVFAVACGETPTSPAPYPEFSGVSAELTEGHEVDVLRRLTPLAEDVVVTRTIGLFGGVIHLPAAGFAVIVPPFAVSSPTTITVVAPAGDLVGYHFFPQGQVFRTPLVAMQN